MPVTLISATCECPAHSGAQCWKCPPTGSRGGVPSPSRPAPHLCGAYVGTGLIGAAGIATGQLAASPRPSAKWARCQGCAPGPRPSFQALVSFFPPRGKPLHCLTAFETDQTGESWLTAKTSLFSLRVFGGGTSDGPSVPWDAGGGRGLLPGTCCWVPGLSRDRAKGPALQRAIRRRQRHLGSLRSSSSVLREIP